MKIGTMGNAINDGTIDQIVAEARQVAEPSPPTYAATAPRTGFAALEHRLSEEGTRTSTDRKTRSEEWIKIQVTPDVELGVRGPLDGEQRARLERCAELIRDVLIGRE